MIFDLPRLRADRDSLHPDLLLPPILVLRVPVKRLFQAFVERRLGSPAQESLCLLRRTIMPLYLRLLMISGSPDEVAAAAKGHVEQLDRLRAAGQLHLAGEFVNGDGFVEILDVEDRLEAERLTRESPLVERGLTSWSLREWTER